jgi:hypothetical protein
LRQLLNLVRREGAAKLRGQSLQDSFLGGCHLWQEVCGIDGGLGKELSILGRFPGNVHCFYTKSSCEG